LRRSHAVFQLSVHAEWDREQKDDITSDLEAHDEQSLVNLALEEDQEDGDGKVEYAAADVHPDANPSVGNYVAEGSIGAKLEAIDEFLSEERQLVSNSKWHEAVYYHRKSAVDWASWFRIATLGLNHDFGSFFHNIEHDEGTDKNHWNHPVVDDWNDNDDGGCSEESLNRDDWDDWNHQIKSDQVFRETSQNTTDWVWIEKDDVGSQDSLHYCIMEVSGASQNYFEKTEWSDHREQHKDSD